MSIPRSLVLAAACLLSAAGAQAKTFELPDEKPVATVTLPDGWSPEEIDTGAQATSPDTSVYVAVEVSDVRDVKTAAADAVKFLGKNGVKIDPSSMKETATTLNGMEMKDLSWEGVDKDGPTKVSVSLVGASPRKVLILTYWASPKGEKKYEFQLKSILESIQPLGR